MAARNFGIEIAIEQILMETKDWFTAKQMQVRLHTKGIKLSKDTVKEYFEYVHKSNETNHKIIVSLSSNGNKICMTSK